MKHFLTTYFDSEGEFETKLDLTKIKLRLLQEGLLLSVGPESLVKATK